MPFKYKDDTQDKICYYLFKSVLLYYGIFKGEVRLLQSGGGYLQTSQHQQHHAANRLLQQQVSPPALVHNHHQAVTPTSVSNNAGERH